MQTPDIVAMYEDGVQFECGCHEKGLHPSVVRGLQEGRVRPEDVMQCGEHRMPMVRQQTPA